MPQTVPNRPTKGPGRTDRRQHQQPAFQPLDFAGDRDVHHLFDPHLQPGKGSRLAFERPLPFAHRRDETGRHRLRRLGRQRAIKFLDRLAGPERLLEAIHRALGARIKENLVDRDRPDPDRTGQQPQHDHFHDPVRPAETARSAIRRWMPSARLTEPRRPDSLAVSSQRIPKFSRERLAAGSTAARQTRGQAPARKPCCVAWEARPKPRPAFPCQHVKTRAIGASLRP